jgi:AraC-like DNA-binding protein
VSATARMVDVIDQFATSMGVSISSTSSDWIGGRWDSLRSGGLDNPGLALAEWIDLGLVGGIVPPLLANSKDVGSLLDTLARVHPLWGDDEVVIDKKRSGWTAVTLRAAGNAVHPDTFDAFFAVLARMVSQLTRPSIRPARLSMRMHEPPRSHAYNSIAATVRWGAGCDQLEFGPVELATRIAFADPTIAAVLASYAASEVVRHNADWEPRVRSEIRRQPVGTPSLSTVAAALAQSTRTVQQRLLGEGTSYAALVDDERRLRALGLLADLALPVSSAAHQSGYRSIEGFSEPYDVGPACLRQSGASTHGGRSDCDVVVKCVASMHGVCTHFVALPRRQPMSRAIRPGVG